jgi:predicted nucleic acid-binding protein
MNVVDSSGWLEYFVDGPNARFFSGAIEATSSLIVPTISLFEVYRRTAQQGGDEAAIQAVAAMRRGQVVPLSDTVALGAAKLSLEHVIPMADSIMLATAHAHGAVFWTQDSDFEKMPGVRFFRKRAN